MIVEIIAVFIGLVLLVWSADRFIEGAAGTAHYFGMPPLMIGMVIVGFGTSAPELAVSVLSAWQGNSGLALGNAYGSNIANIGLILGVTALVTPMTVRSGVLRKELPILTGVTALAAWQVKNGSVSRLDAVVLLFVFGGLLLWAVIQGRRKDGDVLATLVEQEQQVQLRPLRQSVRLLLMGLVLLVGSSRLLVWGAVGLAESFGVNDLVIGLTIVAIGTSLPELASSLAALRKGEHDIALGNVIGSNLLNTLAVVGVAGAIRPMDFGPEVFLRDIPVMVGLTVSLFIIGYGFCGRPGRINRFEGAVLLCAYCAYTTYLVWSVLSG